jgi:arylsulfatase A-like enzyme
MWRDEWQIVAIRTDAFKYIRDSRSPDRGRLFDLRADPGERHDVSERYPEQVRYFRSRLDAHLQRAAHTAREVNPPVPDIVDEVTRRLRDLGYIE